MAGFVIPRALIAGAVAALVYAMATRRSRAGGNARGFPQPDAGAQHASEGPEGERAQKAEAVAKGERAGRPDAKGEATGPQPAADTEAGAARPALVPAVAGGEATGDGRDARQDAAAPAYDMDGLSERLLAADDPLGLLRREVASIRAQEGHAMVAAEDADETGAEAPCGLALYLARGLEEAGLLADGIRPMRVSAVRPHRANTFYLRIEDPSCAWGDALRVLAVEATLNRALFAWENFGRAMREEGAGEPTLEDCYRFNQALASSITAQLGATPIAAASMADGTGEWATRQAIAAGIETFRLPVRLQASFRVNLMGGDVAIEVSHMPAEVFAASLWSGDLDRVIDLPRQMREQAASAYALRVMLLLAGHALRCSRRICHVWVASTLDTPSRHSCMAWADISREALRGHDLSEGFDAFRLARELGFHMELVGHVLKPVTQGFSLDEERFCPRTRYDEVDLSARVLPRLEGALLGATRVSDLAINEHAHRERVATQIASRLAPAGAGDATQRNVSMIMDVAATDPDPTVRNACERVATKLIDGTLPEGSALALEDEFVSGDELSRACEDAASLLSRGRPQDALGRLADALAPIDALDAFADTDTVVFRAFSSYVDRTLHNRLFDDGGRTVCLVPDAYYNAHVLASTALLLLDRPEAALGHAQRASELDPLNMAGTMRQVRSLERLGRHADAADALCRYLEVAFEPEGIGTSYYRLAYMEYRLGRLDAARACYGKAIMSRSSCSAMAAIELGTLFATTGPELELDMSDVDEALEAAHVPVAPTRRVAEVLLEAAQASCDAEVFPVARNFATLLGLLSGDDVMHDVVGSMELEPDR